MFTEFSQNLKTPSQQPDKKLCTPPRQAWSTHHGQLPAAPPPSALPSKLLPPACTPSRRQGGSWWPRGQQEARPPEGPFSVPPSPGPSQKAQGTQGWVWSASPGLWGRNSRGWATPAPKSRGGPQPRVMTPAASSFLHLLEDISKGQSQERKWKEAQVPRWLYLSPSLVFLSSFCFTAPSHLRGMGTFLMKFCGKHNRFDSWRVVTSYLIIRHSWKHQVQDSIHFEYRHVAFVSRFKCL